MATADVHAPVTQHLAPRSRWPWGLQALLSVVVMIVATFAPLVVLLVPGLARLDDPGSLTMEVLSVLVVVGVCLVTLLVALGGVALLTRLDGHRRLRDVGWRVDRRSLPLLGVGVALSVVVLVGAGVPLTAAGLLRPGDPVDAGSPVWSVLVIGLAQGFVLQAIPEELIFRGYLLRSVRLRPLLAVLVSGVVFAALHLASSGGQQGWGERVVYLADPLGFGLAAGALVLLTGSRWVAIGIHGGIHATVLATTLLEPVFPALAIGNGPALWLLTGLAWTVVAAVAMVALRRREHAAQGVTGGA